MKPIHLCSSVCVQTIMFNPNLVSLILIVTTTIVIKTFNKEKKILKLILFILILTTLFYYDNCASGCLNTGLNIELTILPAIFRQ